MKTLLAILLLSAALAVNTHAQSTNIVVDNGNASGVGWNAPTTNEDGSPLDDLAGYKVYSSEGGSTNVILQGDVLASPYLWGVYPFASGTTNDIFVTAYDNAGNESQPSESLILIVDSLAPSAPTLIILDRSGSAFIFNINNNIVVGQVDGEQLNTL